MCELMTLTFQDFIFDKNIHFLHCNTYILFLHVIDVAKLLVSL